MCGVSVSKAGQRANLVSGLWVVLLLLQNVNFKAGEGTSKATGMALHAALIQRALQRDGLVPVLL